MPEKKRLKLKTDRIALQTGEALFLRKSRRTGIKREVLLRGMDPEVVRRTEEAQRLSREQLEAVTPQRVELRTPQPEPWQTAEIARTMPFELRRSFQEGKGLKGRIGPPWRAPSLLESQGYIREMIFENTVLEKFEPDSPQQKIIQHFSESNPLWRAQAREIEKWRIEHFEAIEAAKKTALNAPHAEVAGAMMAAREKGHGDIALALTDVFTYQYELEGRISPPVGRVARTYEAAARGVEDVLHSLEATTAYLTGQFDVGGAIMATQTGRSIADFPLEGKGEGVWNDLTKGWYNAWRMAPAMLVSAATMGTLGTLPSVAFWQTQIFPRRFHELREMGIGDKKAFVAATLSALFESYVEHMQVRGLTPSGMASVKAGIGPMVMGFMKRYGWELTEEGIQGLSGYVTRGIMAAIEKGSQGFEWDKEAAQELSQLKDTAYALAFMMLPGMGANLTRMVQEGMITEEQAASLREVTDIAETLNIAEAFEKGPPRELERGLTVEERARMFREPPAVRGAEPGDVNILSQRAEGELSPIYITEGMTQREAVEKIAAGERVRVGMYGIDEKYGPVVQPSIAEHAVLQEFAALYNREIVFFEGRAGFAFDRAPNVIAVGTESAKPLLLITTHELVHSFEGTPLYREIAEIAVRHPEILVKATEDYYGMSFEEIKRGYPEREIAQESVARLVEWAAHYETFWETILPELSPLSRRTILNRLIAMYHRFIEVLKRMMSAGRITEREASGFAGELGQAFHKVGMLSRAQVREGVGEIRRAEPLKGLTSKQKGLLHAAALEVGADETARRAVQRDVGGFESAADPGITQQDFLNVMAAWERLAEGKLKRTPEGYWGKAAERGEEIRPPRPPRKPLKPPPTVMSSVKGFLFTLKDEALKLFAPAYRAEEARVTSHVLRRNAAMLARKGEVARTALKKAHRSFMLMGRAKTLDFMDKMEHGQPQADPKLTKTAQTMRDMLEDRRVEIQEHGDLKHYYENYFGHIWKDTQKARAILKRRSLEGSKAFLKKRTIMTIKEGVELGLEPFSYNPVDMVLLKLREMDRYLMAQSLVSDLKLKGLVKLALEAPNEDYVKLNDNAFKVLDPEMREAEVLMGVCRELSVRHEHLNKRFTSRETAQKASIDEIGHVLKERYEMFESMRRLGTGEWTVEGIRHRSLIDSELNALAKLQDIHKGKEAIILWAWINEKGKAQKIAPTIMRSFKETLNLHPELRPLLDPAPSAKDRYYASEPIATLLNNYLSPGLRDNANRLISGTYDRTRKLGNVLNQSQLSFSLFHFFNTFFDTIGSHIGFGLRKIFATKNQQLSGVIDLIAAPISPLPNLWRGRRLMNAYRKNLNAISNKKMRRIVQAVVLAGGRSRLDYYYYNQSIQALQRSLGSLFHGKGAEKVKAVASIPGQAFCSVLEAAMKPVMEWVVPHQKLGLFYRMADHEMKRAQTGDLTDEQLITNLSNAWDSIDNRMGQLVYENLGWNKTLKDILMLTQRSVGWNLGSFREYVGAPFEMLGTRGRVGRGDAWLGHKTCYVLGIIPVYMAVGAVIMRVLAGRWPEEEKDYFYPKTGRKNPDGSDERLQLQTYARDWFSYADDPGRTVRNKLHPLWSMLGDMWGNKDYFETEIRHKGDPVVKQLGQLAEYVGKTFLPISVKSHQQLSERNVPKWKAAIAGFAGLRFAPGFITKSPAQKLMSEYLVARIPRGTRTQEDFDKAQTRRRMIRMLRGGQVIPKEELRMLTSDERKRMLREARLEPFTVSFKKLTFEEALNVYAISTEEEQRKVRGVLIEKKKRSRSLTREQLELFVQLLKREEE